MISHTHTPYTPISAVTGCSAADTSCGQRVFFFFYRCCRSIGNGRYYYFFNGWLKRPDVTRPPPSVWYARIRTPNKRLTAGRIRAVVGTVYGKKAIGKNSIILKKKLFQSSNN